MVSVELDQIYFIQKLNDLERDIRKKLSCKEIDLEEYKKRMNIINKTKIYNKLGIIKYN